MFIKGVTYTNGNGERETVTLTAVLPPSAPLFPVLAVFVDESGQFRTASIDNFRLPARNPISGRHE